MKMKAIYNPSSIKMWTNRKRYWFFPLAALFVDFDELDNQIFLEFIAGMAGPIDYSMVALFAESHTIEVDEHSQQFMPWDGICTTFKYDESVIPLIAIISAKSTAL